jgi:hypothetical protein
LRKLAFLAVVFACFLFTNVAFAQQGDAMIGFGTVMAPGNSGCTFNSSVGYATCPETGGLFTNVSADVIFHRRMGIGFDADWRTSQGAYGGSGGQPYRPILFDFNGVYQPRLSKKVGADLFAGIGWQSTRFYSGNYTCSFVSCINYSSSNHFLVDIGGGLRYYVWNHVFVRPEAHYYYIHNNDVDFSTNNILRVGASIGYTIGPD